MSTKHWDKNNQRYCIINAEEGTCTLNFMTHSITINKKTEVYPQDRNQTFLKMHRNILTKSGKEISSYNEGIRVLSLIDGIKKSLEKGGKWVSYQ